MDLPLWHVLLLCPSARSLKRSSEASRANEGGAWCEGLQAEYLRDIGGTGRHGWGALEDTLPSLGGARGDHSRDWGRPHVG